MRYYIYLSALFLTLNAYGGSSSEEVLQLSTLQKARINQNMEMLQTKLRSEEDESQIVKLQTSLNRYEKRLENPISYLKKLQKERKYEQRAYVRKRRSDYQRKYKQRDYVKKKTQEHNQRSGIKKRPQEDDQLPEYIKKRRAYDRQYYQRDYVKKQRQEYYQRSGIKKRTREHEVTTTSFDIEAQIASWFSYKEDQWIT